jgi:hypothetical protein
MRRWPTLWRSSVLTAMIGILVAAPAKAMPNLPPVFQRLLPAVRSARPAIAPHVQPASRGNGTMLRVPIVGGLIRWPSTIHLTQSPSPSTDSAAGTDPKHGSDLAFHLPVWSLGF